MASASYQRKETFLDVPFSVEEVEHILHNRMKLRKASGPDGLTTEHLRYGGPAVVHWLTEISNSIIELEQIPPLLKQGITIPVYKGGGRDPLDVNSYRGITLNSALSKVLESLILGRLEPLLSNSGILHPNQSAYRKSVSCVDAIFATQEMINGYMQEGCKVFMCFYDLQKAFDSVEFPVLLHRLFVSGDLAPTSKLVYQLHQLCACGLPQLPHLPTTVGSPPRIDSITLPLSSCYGSTAEAAPVSFPRHLHKQHLCWRIPTCRRHTYTC